MKGCHIVIPAPMKKEILVQLHTGHQGITKCRERAKQSVLWPGIGKQLVDVIQACPECCRERLQPATPLKPSMGNSSNRSILLEGFHIPSGCGLSVLIY